MTDYVYKEILKPFNQCNLMGLETIVKREVIKPYVITVSKDNFKQYRITLKDIETKQIVSSVLYDQFRIAKFKYTLPEYRGNQFTRQLHSYIQRIVNRKFFVSDNLTVAGLAAI